MTYLPRPLDASPLERIRSERLALLRDRDYLSNDLLPAMGVTNVAAPHLFPPELAHRVGRGLQPIQLPIQFGAYLTAVADQHVHSYLEIGVEHGGAFAITVEYLRRFGLRRALAVDLGPTPLLFRKWSRPEVTFVAVDSHSAAFGEVLREHGPFDLALIDGDHEEAGVWADFEAVRPHARILAFHDIVEAGFPDVGRVWRAVKDGYADEYSFHEFTEQYPDAPFPKLGIGLAIRKS
jgi:cephalosporin hydroxylase